MSKEQEKQNPEELNRISREQETSGDLLSTPLVVSHVVNGKIKKRYDYIMVSPHWDVVDVQYRYEEAIKHGGDHAVVMASLCPGF